MNTSTSTQKTNVLEYDYFTMYSSISTITLECNHDCFHDYFKEYPVSNIKATFMESLGVILVLFFKNVLTDYCYLLSSRDGVIVLMYSYSSTSAF